MSKRLVSATSVAGWEAQIRAAVTTALSQQEADVRAALRSHGVTVGLTAAASRKAKVGALVGLTAVALWSADKWSKRVSGLVAPVAATVAAAALDEAHGALAAGGVATAGVADTIATRITDLATGAGGAIGNRLNEAVATAADGEKLGAGMSAIFDTADTILGDQVGAGAQAAANLATMDAVGYVEGLQSRDYLGITAIWFAVGDTQTRPEHLAATGQEVPSGQPFTVGKELLMCPGDPAGSDWNTINCRCWTEVGGGGETPGTTGRYGTTGTTEDDAGT